MPFYILLSECEVKFATVTAVADVSDEALAQNVLLLWTELHLCVGQVSVCWHNC